MRRSYCCRRHSRVCACAFGFRINPATWPVEGTWFFNPLAWQLVFVLGFVSAEEEGLGELVRLNIHWLRWVCGAIVIVMMLTASRRRATALNQARSSGPSGDSHVTARPM